MAQNWNRAKIASRLGLSTRIQQIDVIDTALAALESSPLLREGLIPKLPKRSPRKREDYKCGHCGMKKRSHYCVGGETVQEEVEATPAKKRKHYKPLTVLLMDTQAQQTQQHLFEIKRIGESNIEVKVRYVTNDGIFNIYAEANWGSNKDIYIGQLSDFYKEYVKASIDDGTLKSVELTPIAEAFSPELNHTLLVAQLTLYRSTSWRTKRLSEVEWRTTSKKKKFKNDGSQSPSLSESEPSSPQQHMPQPPQPPSPSHLHHDDSSESNFSIRQPLLVSDMLAAPQPYNPEKSDSTSLSNPISNTNALLSPHTDPYMSILPMRSPELSFFGSHVLPYDTLLNDPQLQARLQRIAPQLLAVSQQQVVFPETPVPLTQAHVQLQ